MKHSRPYTPGQSPAEQRQRWGEIMLSDQKSDSDEMGSEPQISATFQFSPIQGELECDAW